MQTLTMFWCNLGSLRSVHSMIVNNNAIATAIATATAIAIAIAITIAIAQILISNHSI